MRSILQNACRACTPCAVYPQACRRQPAMNSTCRRLPPARILPPACVIQLTCETRPSHSSFDGQSTLASGGR